MDPSTLVGESTWKKLQEGEVISSAVDNDFLTQKTSWVRKIIRVFNPKNWLCSGRDRQCVVGELQRRVVRLSNKNNTNQLSLKMAAAGVVKIKKVSFAGVLETTPLGELSESKVKAFCELPDSTGKLIDQIKNKKTRNLLRKYNFDALLKADYEKVEEYSNCVLPVLSWQSTTTKNIKELLGDSIKSGLYMLAEETNLAECIERIKQVSIGNMKVKERFQYNIDVLMLRTHMAKAGLITADGMLFAWQHFLEETSDQSILKIEVAKEFLKKPDNGVNLMKMVRSFKENEVASLSNDSDQYENYRELAKEHYKPEMERAAESPWLVNISNRCYYNSMIKLLTNQFSMVDLDAMDSVPRPLCYSEQLKQSEGELEDHTIVQRQQLYKRLIGLLRVIKLCRAKVPGCDENTVNYLSRLFHDQLVECKDDGLIAEMFEKDNQQDAHEFAQVISKILNFTENPKFSYNSTSRIQTIDGVQQLKAKSQREVAITTSVIEGRLESYSVCMSDLKKEEDIVYYWDEESIARFKHNGAAPLLERNKDNLANYRKNLETFKKNLSVYSLHSGDKDFVAAVESMVLKDDGYFERTLPNGAKKLSIIPPWVRTTYKPVLEVDTEQVESLMLTPKIFTYGDTTIKLEAEGLAFFRSCKDGINIPVVDKQGKPSTLVMNVSGICCHNGQAGGGHYVYIEKGEDNNWILNDDVYTVKIGDDANLDKYLKGKNMTPYIYYLKKDRVLPLAREAVSADVG